MLVPFPPHPPEPWQTLTSWSDDLEEKEGHLSDFDGAAVASG